MTAVVRASLGVMAMTLALGACSGSSSPASTSGSGAAIFRLTNDTSASVVAVTVPQAMKPSGYRIGHHTREVGICVTALAIGCQPYQKATIAPGSSFDFARISVPIGGQPREIVVYRTGRFPVCTALPPSFGAPRLVESITDVIASNDC